MEILTQRRRVCWFSFFVFGFCFLRKLWPNRNILHNSKSALHINAIIQFTTTNSVIWTILPATARNSSTSWKGQYSSCHGNTCSCRARWRLCKSSGRSAATLAPQGKFVEDIIEESSSGDGLQPPAPASCVSHEGLSLAHWSCPPLVLVKPLIRSKLQLVNCCYWLHTAKLILTCIL